MKRYSVEDRFPAITGTAACILCCLASGGLNCVTAQVTFVPITVGPLVEDAGKFLAFGLGDYDNDGYVDVTVGSQAVGAMLHLYHNNGDGTFGRITDGILVTDPISPGGGIWADQDNDGDLDLFVSAFNNRANAFYRNDGTAGYVKVTDGAWVGTPGKWNAAGWGDYDGDGLVDLFVNNDSVSNALYHNNGDGSMTLVDTPANTLPGKSRGIRWSDFDRDGDVDLFVVGNASRVQFRNDGSEIFTWISEENGGIPGYGHVADVGLFSADYDNDGDLDMFFPTWNRNPRSMLYRNDGKSGYVQATDVLPAGGAIDAMISAWGDYDNDGHQDLFVTDHSNVGGNILYHNEGDGGFTRVTGSPVAGARQASGAGAWLDYDNDGDLDLLVTNGFQTDTPQTCELYRNDGGTNHWISLKLIGTVSNRSAIGAKVWALANIDGTETTQLREIHGTGEDLRVHFGLGDAKVVEGLRIDWPSGAVQVFSNVAADQFLTIEEEYLGSAVANISTRGQVGTGDDILIAGFVISGNVRQKVLVRASGQTLSDFGVYDVLEDAVLTLFTSEGAQIATNTNWGDAANASEIAVAIETVGAFAFPADATDSAILMTLDPGAYTAQVRGNGGATGNAIVEIYVVE